MKEIKSLKLKFSVGALIRKDVINEIKNTCYDHNLTLDIDESKGWLSSDYRIKITGDSKVLEALQPILERWFEKMSRQ